jgi:chaperonin GroEL
MTTDIEYGISAKKRLAKGVEKLVEAVAQTLGANGSNVTLIDNVNDPIITKDGVTVARSIRLFDYVENAGANIVRQAAISSADLAGDGTTTTTVIAGYMIKEGINLDEKLNMFEVRKGMEKCVAEVIKHLQDNSKTATTKEVIKQVATISANNNSQIGETVSSIVNKLGKGAVITISKERKENTYIDERDGYTYYRPLESPYLSHIEGDMFSEIENPKLLVVDDCINSIEDIIPVLNYTVKNKTPLVIMANDYHSNFYESIHKNIFHGSIDVRNFCFVKTPNENDRMTESLIDIVKCSKSKLMSISNEGTKLKDFTPDCLGELKMFRTNNVETTFIFTEEGGKIAEKITKDLEESIKGKEGSLRDRVEERMKRLNKGSAILYIGSKTDAEHKEMYDIYEDSIKACQSALEEGVVDGGGLALYRASLNISVDAETESEQKGVDIVLKACREPMNRIILSSGKSVDDVLMEIKESNYTKGFNAKNGNVDFMIKNGIIDPLKVTRVALQSAMSSATTILTTNAVIFPHKFEDPTNLTFKGIA